jgi:predicted transposase/invertase (TIGR01784 family)
MAYETQVTVSQDDIEKAWFMSRLKYKLDESHNRSVWIKQGISQGISQGSSQALYKVAKQLFAKNMTIDFISDTTGLSESELRAIQVDNSN